MRTLLVVCALVALPTLALGEELQGPVFQDPLKLQAGDAPVAVESPGFAAPTLVDLDGDGKRDLVVGQFSQGKLHLFRNEGTDTAPKFAKGTFLLTGDKPALVPDVW